jgi:hypothetical protein
MKTLLTLLLAVLIFLLPACATAPPPPSPASAYATLNINSVAVGPVAYATYQPDAQCTVSIDDDLRVALVLGLTSRGYDAFAVGNSVPRSFAAGSPPPQPGDLPPVGPVPSSDVNGLLSVWIEEYWEHNPCGVMEAGDPSITMGAVAVLYAGSPPVEVWRSRARSEQRGHSGRDLIWLATTRLTDQLLKSLPAGTGRAGQR